MAIPVPGRVAEALRRSTVQIRSGRGFREGNGSGAAIGAEQVITNAHVVQSQRVTVDSWEGKSITGTVLKLDRRRDLALLSAPGLNGMPVTLGDSNLLRPGTPVVAVGNPFGFVGALSSGVVHRVGRMQMHSISIPETDWICADVRLAPGNSGGPLADFSGQVVGINTMIAAGGLAFAVASRAVQAFLKRPVSPPSLGITVRPIALHDGHPGLLILEIAEGGAAQAASLLPGDMLTAADGKRFESLDDLAAALEQASGNRIELSFYRAGRESLRRVTAQLRTHTMPNAA